MLLHDPSEFPEVNKKGIFIGSGQEASIAIDAEVSAYIVFVIQKSDGNPKVEMLHWKKKQRYLV